MLKSDISISDNKLFNKLTSEFRKIGAKNWKGSLSIGTPSEHESSLISHALNHYTDNGNKRLSDAISSIGNFFVEIRTGSFVFVQKITGIKITINNPS